MSPQDYSTLKGTKPLQYGLNIDGHIKPELTARVARVIGLYSAIDIEAMKLAATCIGNDFLLSSRLLQSFKANPSTRTTILRVAAEARFRKQPEDWALVQKVIARVGSAHRIRDPLVHWVWALDGTRPEIFLLVRPETFVQMHGAVRAAEATGIVKKEVTPHGSRKSITPTENLQAHYRTPLDRGQTKYYTQDELDGFIKSFRETLRFLRLAEELASMDPDEADSARRQLSNEL